MKPRMKQHLTLQIPKVDSNGKQVLDKYSKPITTSKNFICRTREHGEVNNTAQIRVEDARDEIDVLPDTPVQENLEVRYTTISGEVKKGTIKAIAETTNLTASKVYFRTCVVDG